MAAVAPGAYAELPDPEVAASLNRSLKFAEQEIRQGFIRKVYGILCVQLLVTVAVAYPIQRRGPTWVDAHPWLVWVSMFGSMAIVCSFLCCRDTVKKVPLNYIMLFGFTVFEGMLVGVITSMYTSQSVLIAMATTAAITAGMTILACTIKIDVTAYAMYFYGFLMAVVCFGFSLCLLSMMGVHSNAMMMVYNFLAVLVFTMYLVFDTQMIVGGNHQMQFDIDDYVIAALQVYLDIINLFIQLLQMFGDRN